MLPLSLFDSGESSEMQKTHQCPSSPRDGLGSQCNLVQVRKMQLGEYGNWLTRAGRGEAECLGLCGWHSWALKKNTAITLSTCGLSVFSLMLPISLSAGDWRQSIPGSLGFWTSADVTWGWPKLPTGPFSLGVSFDSIPTSC